MLGHISAGESSLFTAIREIEEEIGLNLNLNISIDSFRYVFSYRKEEKISDNFIERQFYDFFILRMEKIDIKKLKMQESEVQAIKFVDIKELLEMYNNKILVDRKPIYDELKKCINKDQNI